MADTTDSKHLGKRPESDHQPQQQQSATTGDVVQMENVNNTISSQSHTQPQETDPSIPPTATATASGANMPVSLQDVMTDHTDPASPASPSAAAGQQPDPDSISQASASPPQQPTTDTPSAPTVSITLLLPTGARHPYKIDEKYLAKRNVTIPETDPETGLPDPFSISVYKLKELILREWREEWEGKPASPTSIRLIHFGKLLDDKEGLKKYRFSPDTPNVVHMSVRPAEMMEEDAEGAKGAGKSSSGREGSRREGGSGCCVIL
ncbi:ubiquitin-related domain-containing protein [Sordaria brevicollis]|uniref:Ubiquitin-related domain-containing protein n=1 Tax=Sordaria brevicollis TaxID=83679 RepID=A0AAE0PFD6_SORBR|nr:ubiquitin-related domain-containing protein [Sordaria brevicollis]